MVIVIDMLSELLLSLSNLKDLGLTLRPVTRSLVFDGLLNFSLQMDLVKFMLNQNTLSFSLFTMKIVLLCIGY